MTGHPTVDIKGLTNAAPLEIYSSINYINKNQPASLLSCTASNLLQTETYKVRLHFTPWPFGKGTVLQDIKINGAIIESNFDPCALNKASIVEAPSIKPDASNQIAIEIAPHPGSGGNAAISGIEILINE